MTRASIRFAGRLGVVITGLLALAFLGGAPDARGAPLAPPSTKAAPPSDNQLPDQPAAEDPTAEDALAAPVTSRLAVVGGTTIVVDPACTAWGGATLTLRLSNKGAPAIPLDLRLDPLLSEAGATPTTTTLDITSLEPPGPPPKEIGGHAILKLALTVKGILGPGKWSAVLYNGQSRVTTVSVLVPEAPLHLRLDAGDPSAPAITVERHTPFALMVENTDPVGYQIDWDFRAGSTPGGSPQEAKIPAGGTATLVIDPRDEWFTTAGVGSFASLFNDGTADGFLSVRLHADCKSAGAPMKLLRLTTHLAYHPAATKTLWSYLTLLGVLLAGALCSLYVNFKFPDQQIRRELNGRLKGIGAAVGSLPKRLASRLRVLVGVEQRLLTERLKSLSWYNVAFETQRADIAAAAERLDRRVSLLDRMGRLRETYEEAMKLEVPPSILERVERMFESTVRLLNAIRPPDGDIQSAEGILAQIEKDLLEWSQPETSLAGEIASLLQSLSAEITSPTGGLCTSPAWGNLSHDIAKLIKQQLAASPAPDPAQVLLDLLAKDRLAFRGKLLREYALLCDARAPIAGTPLETRQEELIRNLGTDDWSAMRAARRLLSEMSENIYADDLRKEIAEQRVEIETDRNLTRVFEPGQFSLKFHIKRFETATAREEWSSTWNFGHVALGSPDQAINYLEEEGWSVAHYFPEGRRYTVRVRFRHEDKGDFKNRDGKIVAIERDVLVGAGDTQITGDFAGIRRAARAFRLWSVENGSSVANLALGLAPAILALVAGAKDQVLKMDLFPALCAVFVAGFGSDQVRSLLSQKRP